MSIKIDVAPLLAKVGNSSKIKLEEKVSYLEDGLNLKTPVSIAAELINTGEIVLVKARVAAKVESECGRCLLKFDFPLEFDFEEEFSRSIRPIPENKKSRELTKEDFIFKIEKDNTIDLSEVIRQNILTELPIKPLCEKCMKEGGSHAAAKEKTHAVQTG